MKAIKIMSLAMLAFLFTGNAVAQRVVGQQVHTTSAVSSNQEYFTDVKTLTTYFKNHEIPASFPKYDKTLGEEGNAKAAMLWTEDSANYALLSPLGIKTLEEYKAEQKASSQKK